MSEGGSFTWAAAGRSERKVSDALQGHQVAVSMVAFTLYCLQSSALKQLM